MPELVPSPLPAVHVYEFVGNGRSSKFPLGAVHRFHLYTCEDEPQVIKNYSTLWPNYTITYLGISPEPALEPSNV